MALIKEIEYFAYTTALAVDEDHCTGMWGLEKR